MSSVSKKVARLLFILALIANPALADAQTVGLSPQAQEALDHGLAAARQQDYKQAIQYFLDAQKAAPDASQIWFNLGLASSKLPGYELRSTAWFRAYVLVEPTSPNVPAIRAQMAATERGFKDKVHKILEQTQAAASELSKSDMERVLGSARSFAVPYIVAAYNFLGDEEAAAHAQQAFSLTQEELYRAAGGLDYRRSLASNGRFPGAEYFLERGNLRGAQETVESQNGGGSYYDWQGIACAAYGSKDKIALTFAVTKIKAFLMTRITNGDLLSYLTDGAEFLVSINERDELKALAEAAKANKMDVQWAEKALANTRAATPCDAGDWWAKVPTGFLTRVGRDGVMLDPKQNLDETRIGEFVAQRTAKIGSNSKYAANADELQFLTHSIANMAETFRQVHGPFHE